MNHWAVSFLHVVPGLPWMLDLRKERGLQQLASLVVALLAETLRLDTLEQSKVHSFFKENRAYVRFSFTWKLHGSHDVVVISVDIIVVYFLSGGGGGECRHRTLYAGLALFFHSLLYHTEWDPSNRPF